MYKVNTNVVKLVNKYTKEEVYTRDYDDFVKEGTRIVSNQFSGRNYSNEKVIEI